MGAVAWAMRQRSVSHPRQLKPELLERACARAGVSLTLRRHKGYDHSYFFISTFIEDHLHWHAQRLGIATALKH